MSFSFSFLAHLECSRCHTLYSADATNPQDFARTIDLVTSGKLTPGSTTGPLQPLESLSTLLEAMAIGKLDAKPLIAVRPVSI
jgi:hypothetical protein